MLIQKSCSRPSRVHQVPSRITTSAGLGMKILLTHPLAESSHHIVSGMTSPATANAQYHPRVMLPRKVHSGLCVGGMLRGFAMDGKVLATLMSTGIGSLTRRGNEGEGSEERRARRQRRRSYAREPLRDSLLQLA